MLSQKRKGNGHWVKGDEIKTIKKEDQKTGKGKSRLQRTEGGVQKREKAVVFANPQRDKKRGAGTEFDCD